MTLKNKPGRIDRICQEFEKMVDEEALTLHHSQVLHGLLNLAGGYYSGRGIRHLGSGHSGLLDLRRLSAAHDFGKLRTLAAKAKEVLRGTPPRELRADFTREPICIWSDGSWEDGHLGLEPRQRAVSPWTRSCARSGVSMPPLARLLLLRDPRQEV